MMHFYPELVDMGALPADPAVRPEGVAGEDPRYHASPALGQAATDEAAARLCQELQALCEQLK